MTLTVPDDVWAAFVAARERHAAIPEKTKPMYSGGHALTVEAATTALDLQRAMVAVLREAEEWL